MTTAASTSRSMLGDMCGGSQRHRRAELAAIALQEAVGIPAMISGALLIARSDGSLLGMTVADLHRGPFHDFLVPGLVLLLVIGCGAVTAGLLLWRRAPHANRVAVMVGSALICMEVVELVTLTFNAQQLVMLAAGCAMVTLASGHRFASPSRTHTEG